jgi:superfamily II DNA or RNA helicase
MEPGTAYLSGLLWLPKELVDLRQLKASLTFTPNATSKLKKQREPLLAWADGVHHIGVPRYIWGPFDGEVFRNRFTDWGIPLIDLRPKEFETVPMRSQVVLDAIRHDGVQQAAVARLLQHDAGGLVISCGVGKTVIALHAAAQFRNPFIVIVDSSGLQQQWKDEIHRHLVMDDGSPVPVGLVGDGHHDWDKPVVVALVETLYRMANEQTLPVEVRNRFAVAIFDEAQIMGAKEFSKAAPLFAGRRYWLSATPRRQDGLEQMYYLHLGPARMTYLKQDLRPSFYFYRVQHRIDPADPMFKAHVMLYNQINIPKLHTYLAGLQPRTYEIVDLIKQGAAQGRNILVLSDRRYMLQQLHALLPDASVVHGGVKGEQRTVATNRGKILICQLRLGEKALNKQALDMLVVCEPFSWEGSFQQIIGRAQRLVPGKHLPIVIFVEDHIGPCLRTCRKLKQLIVSWPPDRGGPYSWRYLSAEGSGA